MESFPTQQNGSEKGKKLLQVGSVGTFETMRGEGGFSYPSTSSTIEGARQSENNLFDVHNERRPNSLPSSEDVQGRRSLCANRDLMELAGVLRGIHSRAMKEGYRFEDGEYKL